jgi:4'-phosphopantetheinyl transferase
MEYKLEFNLSHSGNYVLIVVAEEHKVGIDVEKIRPDMENESIANRFFSSREVSELMAVPPEQRKLAFFNCWTRKEAYIKAQGLGLSLPLDSFDVSLTPNEPVILRATRPDANEASRWTLVSLEFDSNYAAALAVEGKDFKLRLWDWNTSYSVTDSLPRH